LFDFAALSFGQQKKTQKENSSSPNTHTDTHTEKRNALNGMIIEMIEKRE